MIRARDARATRELALRADDDKRRTRSTTRAALAKQVCETRRALDSRDSSRRERLLARVVRETREILRDENDERSP